MIKILKKKKNTLISLNASVFVFHPPNHFLRNGPLALKSTAVFLQMGVGVHARLSSGASWVMSLKHVRPAALMTAAPCGSSPSQNSEKQNQQKGIESLRLNRSKGR